MKGREFIRPAILINEKPGSALLRYRETATKWVTGIALASQEYEFRKEQPGGNPVHLHGVAFPHKHLIELPNNFLRVPLRVNNREEMERWVLWKMSHPRVMSQRLWEDLSRQKS